MRKVDWKEREQLRKTGQMCVKKKAYLLGHRVLGKAQIKQISAGNGRNIVTIVAVRRIGGPHVEDVPLAPSVVPLRSNEREG